MPNLEMKRGDIVRITTQPEYWADDLVDVVGIALEVSDDNPIIVAIGIDGRPIGGGPVDLLERLPGDRVAQGVEGGLRQGARRLGRLLGKSADDLFGYLFL